MSFTIYHNPRCGKSRDTLKILRDKGIEPTIIEYLKTPPGADDLKDILDKLGMSAAQLMRKKEGKDAGLSTDMAEEDLIAGMVANPKSIERPIVISGDKAVLGRPPENVLDLL